MTVIKIIEAHLRAGGYGGLVAPDGECGCEVDDLVPCCGDCGGCEPAYKHLDPRPGRAGDWLMWRQQEQPTAEQWEGVTYQT